MQHQKTVDEEHTTRGHNDKNLMTLLEGLKDRQLWLKRDQIIGSILDDGPRSFTKLSVKDVYGKDLGLEERSRSTIKYGNTHSSEARVKYAQKTFFRALEEEQKVISRQNMQLLGLTIQKIESVPKGKKCAIGEISQTAVTTMQPSEVLNLQNCQNMPQYESQMVDKKLMFSRGLRAFNKRPQSIRVRGKDGSKSPQKKRQSMKPVNSQYQNPIYQARILSYRELIFKLQWSYGLFSEMDGQDEIKSDKKLKVYIGGGNNSPLIRELMKRRFWWQIIDDKTNMDVNFIWTQLKVPDYFNKQAHSSLWTLNQGIRKQQDSQKQLKEVFMREMSRDLKVRSKSRKDKQKQREWLREQKDIAKIMPQWQVKMFQSMIRPHRSKPLYQRQNLISGKQWTSEGEKVHNHLTSNFHLGNKKALFYNLKEYYDLIGGNLFKVMPLTFHIKKGNKDPQYKRFIAYHKKRQAHIKKQQKQMQSGQKVRRPLRNIWIVKPGQLTNRGHGITVIDQIYELDGIMKGDKKHDNGLQKTFIVQLYIDRPFLYKRRKFDIRHFMMVSQLHGVFKAYWFRQGYIRTASYDFDVYDFDRDIHLTNDAVQKCTPYYGRYEPANKVSYQDFQKYLDSNYKDKYSFEDQIMPKMKEIALDAIRSTFVKLSPERKKHNFEIFGLDFMIDGNFQPWLIQANTNPCLELSCPLLARIVPQMVDQALRLTLDVVYPPPTHYPNTAKHNVPDASLQSLKWELMFDERVEGHKLRQLYRRSRDDMMAQIGNVSDDEVFQDLGQQGQQGQQVQLQQLL